VANCFLKPWIGEETQARWLPAKARLCGLQNTGATHPSEGARAAHGGLYRQNDTRHARGMLKWPHDPPPQVAPGGKNRSDIPSHPAGAWVSRQGGPKARNRLFP
jgi:hypothetical protein